MDTLIIADAATIGPKSLHFINIFPTKHTIEDTPSIKDRVLAPKTFITKCVDYKRTYMHNKEINYTHDGRMLLHATHKPMRMSTLNKLAIPC